MGHVCKLARNRYAYDIIQEISHEEHLCIRNNKCECVRVKESIINTERHVPSLPITIDCFDYFAKLVGTLMACITSRLDIGILNIPKLCFKVASCASILVAATQSVIV